MIKALLFDFSRTLLHPAEHVPGGSINTYYRGLLQTGYYNFNDHFQFDEDLLTFLETIKENHRLYIFTTGSIQDDPEVIAKIQDLFIHIFTVPIVGKEKTDPDAYMLIVKQLDLHPEEILFIDDTEMNLEAAKKAGLHTVHYRDSKQTIQDIKRLIGIV